MCTLPVAVVLVAGLVDTGPAWAQVPIEDELVLQTPVSKFIVDAALKAFADYAKGRWGVALKTNAPPDSSPCSSNTTSRHPSFVR